MGNEYVTIRRDFGGFGIYLVSGFILREWSYEDALFSDSMCIECVVGNDLVKALWTEIHEPTRCYITRRYSLMSDPFGMKMTVSL
ncbi:hypothetical protein D5086_019742 [Populus alba]|uniref:Uncharacterized protein n=1 Tax=Populus alba TaxID=43335 RepID=A0ACC4BJN1_POPAL